MTLQTKIVDDFVVFLKVDRLVSVNTINSYKRDISQLFNVLSIVDVEHLRDLSVIEIGRWFAFLRKNDVINRSLNRKVSALKMFFLFLKDRYGIENDYIANLSGLKFEKKLISYVDGSIVIEILEQLDKVKKYKTRFELLRDKAIVGLLFGAGLRISEMLGLKYRDIGLNTEVLCIIGKGGKQRNVPLLDYSRELCLEYKKECEILFSRSKLSEMNLFLSLRGENLSARWVQKMFKDLKVRFGIATRFTPHVMRHSCATALLENNASIKHIQELLGHANLNTTQGYTKVGRKHLTQKLKRINW
jgi:integrase/recombinase XerD